MSAAPPPKTRSAWRWCLRHFLPGAGLLLMAFAIFTIAEPERKTMRRLQIPEVDLPELHRPSAGKALADFPVIVLDPGHGGADDGATANGLREKDLTLDVTRRVATRLQALGFPIVLTRTEDVYVSLADRVAIANACPGSLLVSIHFNQASDRAIHGVETFYASDKPPELSRWPWARLLAAFAPPRADEVGREFADALQQAMALRLRDADRGIRPRDLYVVRHTRQPAVLVEPAFISNPAQAAQLRGEPFRERIAASIVEGVTAFATAQKGHPIQMARK